MPKKKKRLSRSVTINVSLTGHPRSLKQALMDLFGASRPQQDAQLETSLSSNDRTVDETHRTGILTPTERQITALLAEGKTNKEIAAALTVELNTIKTHIHNIYKKLGVHTRGQFLEWWSTKAREE